MKRIHAVKGVLAAGLGLLCAGPVLADEHCQFTIVGNASEIQPGVLSASSTQAIPLGGGIEAVLPDGTLFSDLDRLSTEFNLTDDGAQWGSPRFQIALNTDTDPEAEGNVFVYLGTPPNFDDAGNNTWRSTGNLIGAAGARWDFSQLVAGTQVSTYNDVLQQLGNAEVVSVSLVVDGGGADADLEQTVLFRNIQVDDCIAFDADADGVPDAVDRCPDSDTRPLVDIDGGDLSTGGTQIPNRADRFGCTIQDLINDLLEEPNLTHGRFVSAIAQIANDGRKAKLLTNAESNALKRAAAQSNVGKPTTGGNTGGGTGGNTGGGTGGNTGGGTGGVGNGGGNGGNNGGGRGNGNGGGRGNGGGNGRGNARGR